MASTTVFLDLLGPQRASEKGTTCPGDLPPASDPELVERARAARATLTERIIKVVEASPPGSAWAIGTELNLVHRLAGEHPDKTIAFLDRKVCFCSTMK